MFSPPPSFNLTGPCQTKKKFPVSKNITMFHPCQSLQHSSILPQKEGWGAAGVREGRMEEGSCFFNQLQQKTSHFPTLPLPHPQQREAVGMQPDKPDSSEEEST